MRITRVYTRVGDKGTTHLVGGAVVPKDDIRIESYGTVDELNTVLGLARTFNARSEADSASVARLEEVLAHLQNELFNVGADLATRPEDRWEGMHLVGDREVTRLEHWIDGFNDELPPLKEFILPGGGPVGGFLHQARTVCRRAERRVATLVSAQPDVGNGNMRYLNRLSDLLFVLSRWAAKALGEAEFMWRRPE